MKNGIPRIFLFIVLLVLAIVLGKAVSDVAAGTRFFSFLSAGANFGISTVTIDLAVLRLTFGMTINLNVAQALFLLAAIFVYYRVN